MFHGLIRQTFQSPYSADCYKMRHEYNSWPIVNPAVIAASLADIVPALTLASRSSRAGQFRPQRGGPVVSEFFENVTR